MGKPDTKTLLKATAEMTKAWGLANSYVESAATQCKPQKGKPVVDQILSCHVVRNPSYTAVNDFRARVKAVEALLKGFDKKSDAYKVASQLVKLAAKRVQAMDKQLANASKSWDGLYAKVKHIKSK